MMQIMSAYALDMSTYGLDDNIVVTTITWHNGIRKNNELQIDFYP